MAGSAKRDAALVARAEKQRRALELRLAGANYDEIASKLGYTHKSAARKSVRRAIADIVREPAAEVLRLEITRLDALLLGVWRKASSGDLQAVDRALRIMERRAAYEGLDTPRQLRVELTRELELILDRVKTSCAPDVYEQVLAVLAGIDSPAPAQEPPAGPGGDEGGSSGPR